MIEFRRQFQYYYNHFSIMFNNRYRNDSFFLIILQFLFYVFVFFSLGINVFIGIIIDITVNNLWSTSFFWWYLFIFLLLLLCRNIHLYWMQLFKIYKLLKYRIFNRYPRKKSSISTNSYLTGTNDIFMKSYYDIPEKRVSTRVL